jgi:TRAP-type C4-dicarboxylate transport system substrate-binding protein
MLVIAVILTFTLVLGACGNNGAAEEETPEAPPVADDTGDATEEETPPAADDESSAGTPEVTLVLTQHDPDASLPGQYCFAWADMVREKSNGRIEVEVNNGGSIAKPTESLNFVKDGTVDIAWGLQSFYPDAFPMTDGILLPFLPFDSAEQASRVFWDIYENTDFLTKEYEPYKVILLRTNCDAPINTSEKLGSLADLKGKHMRATGSNMISFLQEIGAAPEGIPINELYSVLENGSFDGSVTDWHAVDSFKLYEVSHYYADEKLIYNGYYFLMNKDKYESLPDDLKAIIDECSGQAALDLMAGAWDEETATAQGLVTDNDGEVYKLSDADHQTLIDAAAKVTEGWIDTMTSNGHDAQGLYDKIIETAEKFKS